MAVTDPYASAAEYSARVEKTDSADEGLITAALLTASRIIEGKLERVFNQSAASTVRRFDGSGGALLRVDDLVTIAANGIAVDTDADGTANETFGDGNAWIIKRGDDHGYNASEFSEPWTQLELLPYSSNTTLTTWTKGKRNVAITGTWGWPTLPAGIKEFCVKLARDLRDALHAGASAELFVLDSGLTVRGDTWRLWQDVEREYSRHVPTIA